jgi:tRNA G18 (ribose-2'-O)-methylase SpoU
LNRARHWTGHPTAPTHQGVVAFGAAHRYAELDQVLPQCAQLLIVLDGVEDPHNLGAIIRTAHAAGASAVIVPDRRAAGLTETSPRRLRERWNTCRWCAWAT